MFRTGQRTYLGNVAAQPAAVRVYVYTAATNVKARTNNYATTRYVARTENSVVTMKCVRAKQNAPAIPIAN